MDADETRLYVVCAVIATLNFGLFCASCRSLWRVLRAAARAAYSSPRRRLLALDDEGARTRPGRVMAVLSAYRPWTTQKALLVMVTLTATLRFAWVIAASTAWDPTSGTVMHDVTRFHRGVFFGLDYFQTATAFTLFTTVAKFWAELAYAARQGVGSMRPIGGGDEYIPRGTLPLMWKITRWVQHTASLLAYAAAALAALLQMTVWANNDTFLNDWTGYTEAGLYLISAVVMVTAAYHAVVELRLVPIELPTRRRRVCRIVAVTGSIASCLVARSIVLLWAVSRTISITTDLDVLGLLAYYFALDGLPLAIVLAYNRMVPSSISSALRGARAVPGRGRVAPEEEPLIGGTRGHLDDENPFTNNRPEVHP